MTPQDLSILHAKCFTTPRPWSVAEFATMLKSPSVILCTCPRGFLLGQIAGAEAEVLTLAVDPRHRRAGSGAALLTDFEKTARQAGVVQLFLEVAADNTAALNLYLKTGFTSAGIRKSYYNGPTGQHEDALVLSKNLPPVVVV